VGSGSVRGRKFAPNPKVKGHILGACLLYDMFVVVLLFASLILKMLLVKPVCSRYFRKFLVANLSAEMTKGYINVVKLPDMFDFQGQIFIFCCYFFYWSCKSNVHVLELALTLSWYFFLCFYCN